MLGKLSLAAVQYHHPIIVVAFIFMILASLTVMGLITYLGKWTYLWKEWLTSLDHKKIGIIYITIGIIMGVRGFVDGVMMRSQLLISHGSSQGYLPPEHYDQVFSGHGVIMIFFVAMPFIIGLINFVVPLQIGARDVAFPLMNSISLWLFIAAAFLMNLSLGIGEFAKTGWVAYPPLSGIEASPGVGVNYYILVLQIGGVGTLLTGINFITTILKCRAPGMTFMKMPLFTWSALGSTLLIVGAFPILTTALALLAFDRYLGMHFFTASGGGNMMLYVNWFWAWGHPEVYILVLPAFGVFSEVVATFSRKVLFGYRSMVYSIMTIMIISYLVWLHHFFIMGAGGTVNAVFGIATMIIAIPTGVKVFNWLFTIYRGKVVFATPMLWTAAFLVTFVLGGMTGVMMAIPPADFVLHNSQFLIAHFHQNIVGGTVFGVIAGFLYWFPKAFGFKLNEKLGKIGFYFFVSGFYITFIPLYMLGFMGMTRRINHYDNPDWVLPNAIAAIGIIFFAIGIFFLLSQLVVSFRKRKENLDMTGDPWEGRTLEWSIHSGAPPYNFAVIPNIQSRDEFWYRKENNQLQHRPAEYYDIVIPKNTGIGVFIGIAAAIFGFCVIWYIWWLALLSFISIIVLLLVRAWQDDTFAIIPKEEIKTTEDKLYDIRLAEQWIK